MISTYIVNFSSVLETTLKSVRRKFKQEVIASFNAISTKDFKSDLEVSSLSKLDAEEKNFGQSSDGHVKEYQVQGIADLQAGNMASASYYLCRAAEISSDNLQIALNMELVGDMNAVRQITTKAVCCYKKAFDASIIANRYSWERNDNALRIKEKICNIYFDNENYEPALEKFLELQALEAKEGTSNDNSVIRHRIGLLLYYKDDFAAALEQLWLSLNCVRSLKKKAGTYLESINESYEVDLKDSATLLYCLGLMHEEQKEYKLSILRLLESLALQKQSPENCTDMIASTFARIARCHSKLGEMAESNLYMTLARSVAITNRETSNENKEAILASKQSMWDVTRIIMNAYHKHKHKKRRATPQSDKNNNLRTYGVTSDSLDPPFSSEEQSNFILRSRSSLEGLNMK